jgi:DNA-binding SARP family transcriptional activator
LGTPFPCKVCATQPSVRPVSIDVQTQAVVVAEVAVEKGLGEGHSYTVQRFPCVIGRGSDADLILADDPQRPTLSRRHLRLTLNHGRVMAADLSSNGTRCGERFLQPGEIIEVGESTHFWLGPRTQLRISTRSQEEEGLASAAPGQATATLEVAFLGAFQARVMGCSVADSAWTSRKAFALLALLADTPRVPVACNRIYEALWADEGEVSRQALQATVSRLRKPLRSVEGGQALPEPVVMINNAYTLAWDIRSDVLVFESRANEGLRLLRAGQPNHACGTLEKALECYKGPFLEGYEEGWSERRRAWLAHLALQALDAVSVCYEDLGLLYESLHWRSRLLDQAPTHEASHAAVIRSLLELGQRDMAQQHFEMAVRTLKQQLDVEPGPGLFELGRNLNPGRQR